VGECDPTALVCEWGSWRHHWGDVKVVLHKRLTSEALGDAGESWPGCVGHTQHVHAVVDEGAAVLGHTVNLARECKEANKVLRLQVRSKPY
jgi:hypothetical protein